jgi:hypothetical protein
LSLWRQHERHDCLQSGIAVGSGDDLGSLMALGADSS